jgi:hypothetical protein
MTEQKNNFATAFIKAQAEMVNASKDSTNPHFKSKYADLTAVRDACVPFLNKYGIAVLQPVVQLENKQYIKTTLLHESGEEYSCLTEIMHTQNTAQAHGSGITYARRYGLQSLVCIGAEDDDGEKASEKPKQQSRNDDDEDVRIGAENWFKFFKENAEKCKSISELEKLYKDNDNALKKLSKKYPDLYNLAINCKNSLEAEFLTNPTE